MLIDRISVTAFDAVTRQERMAIQQMSRQKLPRKQQEDAERDVTRTLQAVTRIHCGTKHTVVENAAGYPRLR
jgi:hypothetical protein